MTAEWDQEAFEARLAEMPRQADGQPDVVEIPLVMKGYDIDWDADCANLEVDDCYCYGCTNPVGPHLRSVESRYGEHEEAVWLMVHIDANLRWWCEDCWCEVRDAAREAAEEAEKNAPHDLSICECRGCDEDRHELNYGGPR